MNRHGGMTWREHVDQMQIDHAQEREEATCTCGDPERCYNDQLIEDRDAGWARVVTLEAELVALQAENARLREVAEAAEVYGRQPLPIYRIALQKALEHAKVSDDREGRG